MPGQDVQHDTGGMDVVRQRLGAGGINRIQTIGQHGGEDIDHLPVTARLTFQFALNAADRNRQIPLLEGRPVAQGTGLASQDGYVMQGIEDGFVPPERPGMAADNPAILPTFQPVGIGSDLHRSSYSTGINLSLIHI